MRKSGISIAAILIACVFVLTIAAFAASVYNDYKSGAESAATRFEKLSSKTAETSGIYPSGSKEFIDAFNSAVGAPNFYELLRLEVDGTEVYLYPSVPTKSNSFFVKTFSTRIAGGDGSRIELFANIYALSPTMIFDRAKIAFIVILAGTLTTCILLMYLYLSDSEMKTKKGDEEQKSLFDDDDFGEENSLEDDIDLPEEDLLEEEIDSQEEDEPKFSDESNSQVSEEKTEEEKTAVEVGAKDSVENSNAALPENPVLPEPDFENEKTVAQEEPAKDEAQEDEEQDSTSPGQTLGPKQISQTNGSDEQGLFSPASGFGWESYLSQRLESELVRAASSEQDLALVLVRIPGITSKHECHPKICEALLDTFQYKDFIFEYKTDGFAAIIQDKDVDDAMQSAEKLYAALADILKEAKQNAKPVIGISSRSLRLISVDRLKTEAEQALFHASEDADSPIVAFRVNPEKYRKYISGH